LRVVGLQIFFRILRFKLKVEAAPQKNVIFNSQVRGNKKTKVAKVKKAANMQKSANKLKLKILYISFCSYILFYKNTFIRTRGSFLLKDLRTIPSSAEEQSFKFSIKVVNKNSSKCRTICKVHFASCLFTYNCSFQLRENKQKLHIAHLTNWHNSILVAN